jgi:hypothetical protein
LETMNAANFPNRRKSQLTPGDDRGGAGDYELRIKGCLDSSWSEWFDGLTVTADHANGETVLQGWVADQAALHGLLNKVRNLGLVLLEVSRKQT